MCANLGQYMHWVREREQTRLNKSTSTVERVNNLYICTTSV